MWKVKIKDEKVQPTNNIFVCGLQMIVFIVYDRIIAHCELRIQTVQKVVFFYVKPYCAAL